MATSLELAGLPSSPELPGISLVPLFDPAASEEQRAEPPAIYWEHLGAKAMRSGSWKIVAGKNDGDAWELYDMDADRNEQRNLAGSYPNVVRDMDKQWRAWAEKVGVFERP